MAVSSWLSFNEIGVSRQFSRCCRHPQTRLKIFQRPVTSSVMRRVGYKKDVGTNMPVTMAILLLSVFACSDDKLAHCVLPLSAEEAGEVQQLL